MDQQFFREFFVGESDPLIQGEVAYKQSVKEFNPNSVLSRDYDLLGRVAELKLLTLTVESGLLEALEEKGITLGATEGLLPAIEKARLISGAVENGEFLNNFVGPLVVEPAPLLLPLVVKALKTDAGVFTAAGAAALLAEAGIVITQDNVALDVLAGVPLVGLGAVLLVAGNALSDLPGFINGLLGASPSRSS